MMNFQHNYYKLHRDHYYTMRGKTYPKRNKHNEGDVIEPTLKKVTPLQSVIIETIEFVRIGDCSLEFLKEDAEYQGFTINSHEDYIKLIQSFRQYGEYNMDSVMAKYHLRKV